MKDKVSELRQILNKKKIIEEKKQMHNPQIKNNEMPDDTTPWPTQGLHPSKDAAVSQDESDFPPNQPPQAELPDQRDTAENTQTPATADNKANELALQIEELKKANQLQKDMYLRKVADFDNFKKRLSKEHEEFSKYANEKLITELLPVIDSLEISLSHVTNKDDPIASGVALVLKQFLSALEKHGVTQTSGEGEAFDPNTQEAIGKQKKENTDSNRVITVHRKGYHLHGKVLRAAMVTISE
ncbi:MAG: nucleotide exchange factor GrpE [Deltaproteobacteria bacterium]|nr:nucleotide exchange factor GrpE [Deltaproteobacteria bacterium]